MGGGGGGLGGMGLTGGERGGGEEGMVQTGGRGASGERGANFWRCVGHTWSHLVAPAAHTWSPLMVTHLAPPGHTWSHLAAHPPAAVRYRPPDHTCPRLLVTHSHP